MTEPTTTPTVFTDPFAPLLELLDRLIVTAEHALVGLPAGMLAVRLMRNRDVHWTWALVPLLPFAMAPKLLSGWGLALCVAAIWASYRGRHRHHQDEEAGRDLAVIAAERFSVHDALRSLLAAARARIGEDPRANPPDLFTRDRLIIGREWRGAHVSIPLGGPAGGTHTLVLGAAGSGKTVTQAWILTHAIRRGMGAVVLDPKHDPALRARLEQAATAAERRFLAWTPEGPTTYNPYAHGTPSEIADKALAGERFTEPHYQRQAQRFLGHVVRTLQVAGEPVSLARLAERLDPARLEALAQTLPHEQVHDTLEYLATLTPRQQSELSGVRDRLAIAAESDFAPWLDPHTPDGDAIEDPDRPDRDAPATESFDILGALEERAVVYFSLDSDRRPLLAQMLAVAILLDVQSAIAALQGRPVPCVVAIDEFSAISSEHVTRLFARARSAGVSLLLGTQELADLRLPGREGVEDQVLGNISAMVAHRQVVVQSADTISALAGTTGAWETSHHSHGRHTRRRRQVPRFEPDQLRGLAPGEALVLSFGQERSAHLAHIYSCAQPVPLDGGGRR